MDQSSSSTTSNPDLRQKTYLWFQTFILEKLVPLRNTGPIFRWIFKFPLLLDRLGLRFFITKGILILATTGRRTGKQRCTPMEYGKVQPDGSYIVMSGWAGRTDWYLNALAEPHVTVKIGQMVFKAIAMPLEDEEIAVLLNQVIQFNPASLRFFARWAGPFDSSPEGLAKAAHFFPSLKLKPF